MAQYGTGGGAISPRQVRMADSDTRKALRRSMRARRRALTANERADAAQQLRRRVTGAHFYYAARRIAAYLAFDGEIDPHPIVEHAWRTGRAVFMPVLRRQKRLAFAPYRPDTALAANRYGIAEPVVARTDCIEAGALDLVLMPLVAFDRNANRVGMGGGYYDRTFSHLRYRKYWMHPRLVGLAYEFQSVETVASAAWDVRAWRIATDRNMYPE